MQLRLAVYCAFAALVPLFQSEAASATELVPTVTFVDGTGTIISGANGYLPAAGVRLRQCDIVRTGPKALVQVELEDGGMILLGPDSRFLFGLPYAGEPAVGPSFLLSGWAKIVVPKREKALPYRARTPYFDVVIEAGAAVMRVSADGGQFFVEQGGAVAQASAGNSATRFNVGAGRTYSRKPGQESGAVTDGVDPVLARSLPRSLRDTPPSMLARLKDRTVEPKPASDDVQAEVAQWKKSVREFRSCFVDVDVRSAQEALQRIGFDVGQVDGVLGPRTQTALREFQQQRGLTVSGQLDLDTMRALDVTQRR